MGVRARALCATCGSLRARGGEVAAQARCSTDEHPQLDSPPSIEGVFEGAMRDLVCLWRVPKPRLVAIFEEHEFTEFDAH